MGNLVEDTVRDMNKLSLTSMQTGQLQMQTVVLRWLNSMQPLLPDHLTRSLVSEMDAALIKLSTRDPSYWPEKANDRREEFKEEDAINRERACPERQP